MTASGSEHGRAKKSGKYRRAAARHLLVTVVADRLTRGSLVRRHTNQVVEAKLVDLTIPRWPLAYDGLRIAHVSDFHVGHLMSADRAVGILEAVRDLKPDLVVCTGDVVDLEAGPAPPVLAALGSCGAPLGSLLVLGNHDHLDAPRAIVKAAEACGVLVLDDEMVLVGPAGSRLRVGGIDWARTIGQCSRRVKGVWTAGRGLDLLLSHNPKAFVSAARLGVPLTLSGHTHGNQVALRRKAHLSPRFSRRLKAGIYRRGESMLFVTVGLGAWFPLRVNCPPEMALLTVRRG